MKKKRFSGFGDTTSSSPIIYGPELPTSPDSSGTSSSDLQASIDQVNALPPLYGQSDSAGTDQSGSSSGTPADDSGAQSFKTYVIYGGVAVGVLVGLYFLGKHEAPKAVGLLKKASRKTRAALQALEEEGA